MMVEVIDSIEDALRYIKGYCGKHETCEGRNFCSCRLYNNETKSCFLYSSPVPCDWVINEDDEL